MHGDPLLELIDRQSDLGLIVEVDDVSEGQRAVTTASAGGEVITGFGDTDQEAASHVLVRLMSERVACDDCGRAHLHGPKSVPPWLKRIDTSSWVRLEGCPSQPNDVYTYSPE